jgi:hypothetical protein
LICHVLLSERSQARFSSSTVPDFVCTRQVHVFQALLLRFQFCVRAPGQAPALQSYLESSEWPVRFRLVVISVIWLLLNFFFLLSRIAALLTRWEFFWPRSSFSSRFACLPLFPEITCPARLPQAVPARSRDFFCAPGATGPQLLVSVSGALSSQGSTWSSGSLRPLGFLSASIDFVRCLFDLNVKIFPVSIPQRHGQEHARHRRLQFAAAASKC